MRELNELIKLRHDTLLDPKNSSGIFFFLLMPDKKDFNYNFPYSGPERGGICDILAWDAFYLTIF